jgi:hypothetical protein
MRKLYLLTLLVCFFFAFYGYAQVVFNGNGNSGFGSPIGNSSMSISDDGTTLTVNFTKGSGDFNDYMVMYIDNGTAGRSVIDGDVNDDADSHRRAISNTGSGDLTFPAGFEATHAIAINPGFGGLWSIPTSTVGSNGLGYIDAVGFPASSTTPSFTFSFDWSEIGLTNSDSFPFVVTYGNPNDNGTNMFSSDEGYGNIASGNPGLSAFSFTSVHFYPSGTLNIDEITSEFNFSIFPNPVKNSFTINRDVKELNIYDITGKLVTVKKEIVKGIPIDISNLNTGIYILNVENEIGQQMSSKLVKE